MSDGRDDGANDRRRQVEVAHQRRAAIAAGDATRGAAHVDVEERRAGALGATGCLGHFLRATAGDLHHVDVEPAPLCARLVDPLAAGEAFGCDHFGDDERRPGSARGAPHADVGDAGHRRQHDAPVQDERPDAQRRCPVRHA